MKPAKPLAEIPQCEIWLKEIALLAHQGNRAAALNRLASIFPLLFPETTGADVRGPSRNGHSDPRTLAIAELDFEDDGYRIAEALERSLGAIYVGDLDKWTRKDFLAIPGFGPRGMERLRRALKKVLPGRVKELEEVE